MDYQNEGPFLASAYESLNGVAGMYWYTATAEQYADDPRVGFENGASGESLRKYDCSTPALMGNFPAAALMYRKGYVKRGEPVVMENRPLGDLWNRRMPVIAEDSDNWQAFLVGPVMVSYGNAKPNLVSDLSKFIDRDKKIVRSDTGQIRMDYGARVCTIDAPAAQGVTGFLRKAGEIRLSTIDIASGNEQASVLAVSMDGAALRDSREVLVQIGTPSHLSGWETEAAQFVEGDQEKHEGLKVVKIGEPPWMMDATRVVLTIRNWNLTRASVLDVSGYPVRELALEPDRDGMKIELPRDAMYVVLR
jgi:hypothetical protein